MKRPRLWVPTRCMVQRNANFFLLHFFAGRKATPPVTIATVNCPFLDGGHHASMWAHLQRMSILEALEAAKKAAWVGGGAWM